MKRFQFSLDNVLDYKLKTLENLKTEQAVISQAVQTQEKQVSHAGEVLNSYEGQLNEAKASGAAIERFRLYDLCVVSARGTLDAEKKRLSELTDREERKKKEVVAAKIDTSKFEKLKDRRLETYRKAAAKEEEQFSEEFIVREQVISRIQRGG